MPVSSLTELVKQEASRLGFSMAGVCRADAAPGFDRFREWLERGYHGAMKYLSDRVDAYRHPASVLDDARSIVMLTFDYGSAESQRPPDAVGRVSSYAWGIDYHDVIHQRLKQLVRLTQKQSPECRARGVVHTAPLLERDYARLAGLGWIGKNTLLIHPRRGSWFFLAALLVDVELEYDAPFAADHCGTCTACLDACPTDAFPQPYLLDATKCISYLTIELRDSVPVDLRDGIGEWVFGCDICQQVCPWNQHAPVTAQEALRSRPDNQWMQLAGLFALADDEFRRQFRRTPLWRTKRRGVLRNAAIVLGNRRNVDAIPWLAVGMRDSEEVVRSAAAWAIGRIGGDAARHLLLSRLDVESEEAVLWEIAKALDGMQRARPTPAWTTGTNVARLLDDEDYEAVFPLFADGCTYELRSQLLVGRDRILASYAENGGAALHRFDAVVYDSAVVEVAERCVMIQYREELTRQGRRHTFACRQWLTLNADQRQVIHVRHEDLPGQREALAEFERPAGRE